MMDNCHTCGGEIAGGADHALVLPSPFSSFHVQHHLSCYMATAIAAEREACIALIDSFASMAREVDDDAAFEALCSASDAIRARGGK